MDADRKDAVNLDRARALLGISDDATELEIRRAYLRKVKASTPERDPEGFKQLREAYDLARLWVSAARLDESPASAEPADESDAPPAVDFETRDVEAFADPPDAREHDPFLRLLDQLDSHGLQSVEPELVPLLLSTIADGRAHEIPAELAAQYGLASFAAGRREPAASIVLQWFAYVEYRGVLNEAFDDITLVALRELAQLPPETPAEFVRAMANGLLTFDVEAAGETLVELTRENPKAAEALRMHMIPHALVLRDLYGTALRSQGPIARISYWFEDRPWTGKAAVAIAIALVALLPVCSR